MATAPTKKKTRRPVPPVPAAVNALLCIEQVCQALGGGSVRKLQAMISAGEFPKSDASFGASKRWTSGLVNAWIAEQAEKKEGVS